MDWNEDLKSLILKLRQRKNQLNKEYQVLNDKQQDLLHAIEFERYNAAQGARILKRLKALRAERRIISNELEEVKSILERFDENKTNDVLLKSSKKYTYRTNIISDIFGKQTGDYIKSQNEQKKISDVCKAL